MLEDFLWIISNSSLYWAIVTRFIDMKVTKNVVCFHEQWLNGYTLFLQLSSVIWEIYSDLTARLYGYAMTYRWGQHCSCHVAGREHLCHMWWWSQSATGHEVISPSLCQPLAPVWLVTGQIWAGLGRGWRCAETYLSPPVALSCLQICQYMRNVYKCVVRNCQWIQFEMIKICHNLIHWVEDSGCPKKCPHPVVAIIFLKLLSNHQTSLVSLYSKR